MQRQGYVCAIPNVLCAFWCSQQLSSCPFVSRHRPGVWLGGLPFLALLLTWVQRANQASTECMTA